MNQDDANLCLLKLIKKTKLIYDRDWKNHKFQKMKIASTTEKGDIGEDFLEKILSICGYKNITGPKGRRGQYDVFVKHGDKELFFEVKVATKDVNGSFQFNGIRYDTKYTHLFCLGVSPDGLGYLMYKKSDLHSETLTSMAKGSNAAHKLTKKSGDLRSFDDFENELEDIFNIK